ncbi:MAG TPA: dienelactone hydrolase family protein [Acidimicrobiales bacterium]|nr:dienelactone hydrolase family protein [Acidimicrobiales bacterium]
MTFVSSSPGFPVYVTGSTDSPKALIVLQEGFGVNEHIRSVADRFTDDNYFVIAPHLFHRNGSPEIPYDDVESALAQMATLTKEGLTNDLQATTNFLSGLGFTPASTGVVGFCMGGSVALYAATLGTIGAAVSFYGGGISVGRMGLPPLLEVAEHLVAPWLGLYGDLDAGISISDVEDLRTLTSSLPVVTEIVRYPQAGHGFHCDARASAYNEEAARDADQRTREFLDAQLVPVRL